MIYVGDKIAILCDRKEVYVYVYDREYVPLIYVTKIYGVERRAFDEIKDIVKEGGERAKVFAYMTMLIKNFYSLPEKVFVNRGLSAKDCEAYDGSVYTRVFPVKSGVLENIKKFVPVVGLDAFFRRVFAENLFRG